MKTSFVLDSYVDVLEDKEILEILEFIVKPESKVNGLDIRDIDFPRSATIGGVIKNGEGLIVLGDYTIEAGDRVVVCCLPRAIRKVESLFL